MTINSNRLSNAIDAAEIAFWDTIAARYPEVTTGELSPLEGINLETAMGSAVTEWLMNNENKVIEPLTTEIMLHRIEYFYHGNDILLMTDSDKEHVAYSISQGISEGELCTMIQDEETEIYGYWKINNV